MPVRCMDRLGSLSDYLDGELDEELCAEIERHMAECGNCRLVVDSLRKTIALYRDYGHQEIPDEAKARLYAVLDLRETRDREGLPIEPLECRQDSGPDASARQVSPSAGR
jgi:anti-sigma factor RsiW